MTDAEGTRKLSQPINMTWRQELAAFWSILWPCWVLSVLFAAVLSRITAPPMSSERASYRQEKTGTLKTEECLGIGSLGPIVRLAPAIAGW